MIIFFEDDSLNPYLLDNFLIESLVNRDKTLPYSIYNIDAGAGVSSCLNAADNLSKQNDAYTIIYTNCLELLSNRYAWNEYLKAPEVYLRNENDKFVRIDTLTDRELREGHNLAKMYISGEFDDVEISKEEDR